MHNVDEWHTDRRTDRHQSDRADSADYPTQPHTADHHSVDVAVAHSDAIRAARR